MPLARIFSRNDLPLHFVFPLGPNLNHGSRARACEDRSIQVDSSTSFLELFQVVDHFVCCSIFSRVGMIDTFRPFRRMSENLQLRYSENDVVPSRST
jgi:hypothetical protein